jgi:hypothetical protein
MVAGAAVLLLSSVLVAQEHPLPDPQTAAPEAIAAALLDDRHDQKARQTLATAAAPRAVDVVKALVAGLPDDEAEE